MIKQLFEKLMMTLIFLPFLVILVIHLLLLFAAFSLSIGLGFIVLLIVVTELFAFIASAQ